MEIKVTSSAFKEGEMIHLGIPAMCKCISTNQLADDIKGIKPLLLFR